MNDDEQPNIEALRIYMRQEHIHLDPWIERKICLERSGPKGPQVLLRCRFGCAVGSRGKLLPEKTQESRASLAPVNTAGRCGRRRSQKRPCLFECGILAPACAECLPGVLKQERSRGMDAWGALSNGAEPSQVPGKYEQSSTPVQKSSEQLWAWLCPEVHEIVVGREHDSSVPRAAA